MNDAILKYIKEIFPNKIIDCSFGELTRKLEKHGLLNDIKNAILFYDKFSRSNTKKLLKEAGFLFKDEIGVKEDTEKINSKQTQFIDPDDDLDDLLDSEGFKEEVKKIEIRGSYKENIEIAKDYEKTGDRELRDLLIMRNQRLVKKIASYYHSAVSKTSLTYDDLVSLGNLGLMKAVERFNPDQGNEFSTYAVWWIRQSITRGIADEGFLVRLPVHIQEKILKLEKIISREKFTGKEITKEDLAKQLNCNVNQIDDLLKIKSTFKTIASLDKTVQNDDEDGTTLINLIPDDEGITPEEETLSKIRNEELIILMRNVLRGREFSILVDRFGLKDDKYKTLEEVGQKYGVTRERIRQIETKSLEKIRYYIRRDDNEFFKSCTARKDKRTIGEIQY